MVVIRVHLAFRTPTDATTNMDADEADAAPQQQDAGTVAASGSTPPPPVQAQRSSAGSWVRSVLGSEHAPTAEDIKAGWMAIFSLLAAIAVVSLMGLPLTGPREAEQTGWVGKQDERAVPLPIRRDGAGLGGGVPAEPAIRVDQCLQTSSIYVQ